MPMGSTTDDTRHHAARSKNPRFFKSLIYAAMETAVVRKLADDLEILMVTAPLFIATKIEAFKVAGKGISSEVEIWKMLSQWSMAGLPSSQRFRRKRRISVRTLVLVSTTFWLHQGFSMRCPDTCFRTR